MSRNQASQPKLPLQDRLALHALRLKEEAQAVGPGPERDAMIQRARQADTASQVDKWLMSPSLTTAPLKKCLR